MDFSKYSGLGNDFVLIDCLSPHPPLPIIFPKTSNGENPNSGEGAENLLPTVDVDPFWVRQICNRVTGIGADGVIFILPSPLPLPSQPPVLSVSQFGARTSASGCTMRVFNADGTEAEMCGNGVRCVARFLFDCLKKSVEEGWERREGERNEGEGRWNAAPKSEDKVLFVVHTLSGPRLTSFDVPSSLISVDMGPPLLRARDIPTSLSPDTLPVIEWELSLSRQLHSLHSLPSSFSLPDSLFVTCVNMGNPHCVVFLPPETDILNYPVHAIGPLLESHPAFPARTNVEFVVTMSFTEIRMRVWERGCGETQACGTGACAAAVAAVLTRRCGREVDVHLTCGSLLIEWAEGGSVTMTGPAERLFDGTCTLPLRQSEG